MSMHKIPLSQIEESGLRAHGLDIGTPSQLSDAFRQGVAWGLLAQTERIATIEQQNAELVAALNGWDALIKYNYSGSREAMSAMQICAFNTKDILDKVKQP